MPGGFLRASVCRSVNSHAFGRVWRLVNLRTEECFLVVKFLIEEMKEDGTAQIEQKNKFSVGDSIEIMKPDGRNIPVKVLKMTDEEGNLLESCPHPRQRIYLTLSEMPEQFDLLRCRK